MAVVVGRLGRLLEKLRGVPIVRDLRRYRRPLDAIGRRRDALVDEPDDRLRERFSTIRLGAGGEGDPEETLVEVYALACEAARRAVSMRPFDVQVVAAVALHERRVVEMQTGEGKTLAAVMPACLAALAGRGVHVLTFNDYLARRDAEWMGPIYRLLGLTVGAIQEGQGREARRAAYAADVTYATAKQVGFDLLRDGLCRRPGDRVLRPLHRAIVDEADSILVDEARTPMVIAGAAAGPARDPARLADLVRRLEPGVHYRPDGNARDVQLTEAGVDRVEALLGCGSLHAPESLELLTGVNQALHAEALLRRDVDYIVRDREIVHVDELTGRAVPDRQWPDGLQAALRAKEGLLDRPEGQVLGSISVQHFLTLYPALSGMTATAQAAAEELDEVYGLSVVVIPPNLACVRVDHPDLVFATALAKRDAVVEEVAAARAVGRPVLVGTASVRESEELAAALAAREVPCQVLNARTDELEARIVAEAGGLGAVTISTNMAGRGTDIRLGGADGRDRDRVAALGGLSVIGTNRHESRRIDDQLRGRAGRQGDPGSSRFFVSLEDDLMVRHGVSELLPASFRASPDQPVDDPAAGRAIAKAQRIVEGQCFTIRHSLRRYSSMVEEQRRIVLGLREAALRGEGPSLLAASSPDRFAALAEAVGDRTIREVERELTLFHLDRLWSEHLETLKAIQEGIHLVGLAGQGPLIEFQRRAIEAFDEMLEGVDRAVTESFEAATVTEAGLDLEAEGLGRPSSTWTYLVGDRLFDEARDRMLGSLAFGAGAAFSLGPLVFLAGLVERVKRRRGSRDRA